MLEGRPGDEASLSHHPLHEEKEPTKVAQDQLLEQKIVVLQERQYLEEQQMVEQLPLQQLEDEQLAVEGGAVEETPPAPVRQNTLENVAKIVRVRWV